jgi:hypothetical protein
MAIIVPPWSHKRSYKSTSLRSLAWPFSSSFLGVAAFIYRLAVTKFGYLGATDITLYNIVDSPE